MTAAAKTAKLLWPGLLKAAGDTSREMGGGKNIREKKELISKVRKEPKNNTTPHTCMFKCIYICEHNCPSIPALIFTRTSNYKNLQPEVQ